MKNCTKKLLTNLVALLLGAGLTFAFAPFQFHWLGIIAPAGLLWLWLENNPKNSFWIGFLFGLGLFGAGVYWIYISITIFGEVTPILAGLITAGFIALLALFPATVGYLLNRFFSSHTSSKLFYAFPALWVLSEWVRSWVYSGFPWLFLGYTQMNSPLKGYASIFSVYGVSLTVLLISASMVSAALNFKKHHYQSAYFSLFLILCIYIGGELLNLTLWTKPYGHPISVSLVQGNIPQKIKWSPDHLKLSFDRYRELTEPLWEKSQMIIWPETAIPLPLLQSANFIDKMDQKAITHHNHLLLGIPIQSQTGNYFNAIVSLGHHKEVYLKRLLVPFGEYTPFQNVFARLLHYLNIPMSDLEPGKIAQEPFKFDSLKILPFICYEITFPELVRTNEKSVGLLLTITNDAWYGESAARAQHLEIASMRAVELQRPILFASNNGITAIIKPDGTIQSALPVNKTDVLTDQVQPMIGLTPWMQYGMNPILFILLAFIFLGVRNNLKQAKKLASLQPSSIE